MAQRPNPPFSRPAQRPGPPASEGTTPGEDVRSLPCSAAPPLADGPRRARALGLRSDLLSGTAWLCGHRHRMPPPGSCLGLARAHQAWLSFLLVLCPGLPFGLSSRKSLSKSDMIPPRSGQTLLLSAWTVLSEHLSGTCWAAGAGHTGHLCHLTACLRRHRELVHLAQRGRMPPACQVLLRREGRGERGSRVAVWGAGCGHGCGSCKGPEAGLWLETRRNREEAPVRGASGGDKGRRKAGYVGHGEESGRETEARVSQQRCDPCPPAARAHRLRLGDTGWPVTHSAWGR